MNPTIGTTGGETILQQRIEASIAAAIRTICCAVLLVAAADGLRGHGAWAQSSALDVDMPNVIAIAVGVAPDYLGSDDYQFVAGPSGRVEYSDHRYLKLQATQITANLLPHEYLRLGPAANYRFGRSSVDDTAVDAMQDVEDAFELGAFAGLEFTNKVNPRYRFSVNLDFLHDVSGEYDGFVSTLNTSYWMPLARALTLSLGAGIGYGSSDYMDDFFSVDQADAARSGLNTFTADSGVRDVKASAMLLWHLGRTWHLGLGVQYQRLLGDAEDSPVVDVRGSQDQFLAGIGLAYAW